MRRAPPRIADRRKRTARRPRQQGEATRWSTASKSARCGDGGNEAAPPPRPSRRNRASPDSCEPLGGDQHRVAGEGRGAHVRRIPRARPDPAAGSATAAGRRATSQSTKCSASSPKSPRAVRTGQRVGCSRMPLARVGSHDRGRDRARSSRIDELQPWRFSGSLRAPSRRRRSGRRPPCRAPPASRPGGSWNVAVVDLGVEQQQQPPLRAGQLHAEHVALLHPPLPDGHFEPATVAATRRHGACRPPVHRCSQSAPCSSG